MPRRILEGNVVGDKADKTITVEVERRYMHPMYKKYIRKNDKYAAHDPANAHKIGDRVRIIETRPISKTKTWIVLDGDAPAKEVAKAPAKAKAAPKKDDAKKAPAKKAAAKKDDKPKAEKKPAAKKKAPAAKEKNSTKKKDK